MYALSVIPYKCTIHFLLVGIFLASHPHEALGSSTWSTVQEYLDPTPVLQYLDGIYNWLFSSGSLRNLKTCETKGCIETASRFVSQMNESADPCDNFYEFTCGNFKDAELALRPGISGQSVTTIMEQKLQLLLEDILIGLTNGKYDTPDKPRFYKLIGDAFKSCMDTARLDELGLAPMKERIGKMGGWPVVEGITFDLTKYSKTKALSSVIKQGFLKQNFFDIYIETSLKKRETKKIQVGNPYRLEDPSVELCVTGGKKGTEKLTDMAINVAVLFGAARSMAEMDMPDVIALECKIVKMLYKQNLPERANQYSELSDTEIPDILVEAVQTAVSPNISITKDDFDWGEKMSTEFVSWWKENYNKISDRTFQNFLIYRAVRSMLPLLNSAAQNADVLQYVGKPRLSVCTAFTVERDSIIGNLLNPIIAGVHFNGHWNDIESYGENENMMCISFYVKKFVPRFHVGLTEIFLKKHVPSEWKTDLQTVVQNIKDATYKMLVLATWVPIEIRTIANLKSEAMIKNIISIDEFQNKSVLEKYYEKVEWDQVNLLNSELKLQSLESVLHGFREAVRRDSWEFKIPTRNLLLRAKTLYDVHKNMFWFLPPMSRFPVYAHDVPNNVKYGGVGFINAHEIFHAFDFPTLKFYGQYGEFNLITVAVWSMFEATPGYKKFVDYENCLIDHYSNISVAGIKVKGDDTLRENSADQRAIKAALIALTGINTTEVVQLPGLQKYDSNQMFWISFASSLCTDSTLLYTYGNKTYLDSRSIAPRPARVHGVVSNSKEFAEAFKCPLGSKMNPIRKCSLLQ